MEQKKTLIELYQYCKRKQEIKELMARLDFRNNLDGYLLCDGSTFDEIVELYLNATLVNIKRKHN